jgi:ferritin-like metal-binding protein YciE
MSVKLDDLQKVFVSQLKDIYSAENQLVQALPKMEAGATNPELKKSIHNHLQETRNQAERIEKIFATLDFRPGGHRCKAMEGLIEEGSEILKEAGEPDARDAAIICAAQKVEHYEIATYGTLRAYAKLLGMNVAYDLLTESLEEERATDISLTELAVNSINQLAMQA